MDEFTSAGNESHDQVVDSPAGDEESQQEKNHDSSATESPVEPEFVGFTFKDVSCSRLLAHENPTIVGFKFRNVSQRHLIMQGSSPTIVHSNGNMATSMHADRTPHRRQKDPQSYSQCQLMPLEVTEETYDDDEEMELTLVSPASSHDSNSEDFLQDFQAPTPPESTTETGTGSPTSSNDVQGQAKRHLPGKPWIERSAQQQEVFANEALVEIKNREEVSDIKSTGSDSEIIEANGEASEDHAIAHSEHIKWNPKKKQISATQDADKEGFEKYYEPKSWYLGPYYSDKKYFQADKAECERQFNDLLEKCEGKLKDIETAQTEAENFYARNLSMNFMRTLFVEAFFLIKLLLKWKNLECKDQNSEVKSDLLVLDNQIPFFILKAVHGWISADIKAVQPIPDLEHLILGCLLDQREKSRMPQSQHPPAEKRGIRQALTAWWNPCARTTEAVEGQNREHIVTIEDENYPAIPIKVNNDVPHLLGLFYRKYTENWRTTKGSVHTVCDGERKPTRFPCAKELKERNVKFYVKQTANLLDISFKGGKLKVPFMITNKRFLTILANLVLYEKLKGGDKPVTSLALFLRCLINTEADIRILHEAGIMENEQCNDEELPRILRHICGTADPSEQLYQTHQLSHIFQNLNLFCRDKKNKWYYACHREYCYNPVSVIKLIVSATVFILILFGGAVAGYHIRSKHSH